MDALEAQAKRNGGSLEAEVRELLRGAAIGDSRQSLRDLADRIAALTPNVSQTASWSVLIVAGDLREP